MAEIKTWWTVGRVVKKHGLPLHQVEYIIKTRQIEPAGRAGQAYTYTDAAVNRIVEEARQIERLRHARANGNSQKTSPEVSL